MKERSDNFDDLIFLVGAMEVKITRVPSSVNIAKVGLTTEKSIGA